MSHSLLSKVFANLAASGAVLLGCSPPPPCDSRVIMSARTEWWSLVTPEGVLEQVPT